MYFSAPFLVIVISPTYLGILIHGAPSLIDSKPRTLDVTFSKRTMDSPICHVGNQILANSDDVRAIVGEGPQQGTIEVGPGPRKCTMVSQYTFMSAQTSLCNDNPFPITIQAAAILPYVNAIFTSNCGTDAGTNGQVFDSGESNEPPFNVIVEGGGDSSNQPILTASGPAPSSN